MKLYFVRHGESEANVLNEISNRGVKHPLTAKGCDQARALADALRGIRFARLFSSPLLRATQTADILAGELGLPVEITDALREYDLGVAEGRSDAAAWALYDEVLADWYLRGNYERRPDDGESFLDMKARFVPFVESLVEQYGATDENLLLVGHGGLYRCMLPQVVTNVDFRYALEHGIVNTAYIVVEARPEGLVCLSWCGVSPS